MKPCPYRANHTDNAPSEQPPTHPVAEPELTLDSLLAQVTEENLHTEIDTGPAVGVEIW